MKASVRIGIIAIILTILFGISAFAGNDIELQLDGQRIKTDVPPIIENGRALVPYRALFESMGGQVHWEPKADMATAILGGHRVQMTVNKTTAFVDGIIKELEVPPRIIDGRTMIPLRFVLENLNCHVDWDSNRRLISVISPKEDVLTEVEKIYYEETATSYRIIARGANMITGTRTFSYNEPERYGVDIQNAYFPDKTGNFLTNNNIFNGVRYSQFDQGTVRIVVDLKDKKAGKVSFSEDKSILYIDFEKTEMGDPNLNPDPNEDIEAGKDTEGEGSKPNEPQEGTIAIMPELDWRGSGKLIAIDVGHGGKDPGASGKIGGRTVINEKDLNLDIALRLHELLLQAGANAVLLRDKDVDMSLYSRPEAANEMNADLLISIHNNSAETAVPNGSEVLYYDKVGLEDYGISSKELAKHINDQLTREIGLKDRGIKDSPHLAVLNKSLMPAVIIEGAFLSNPTDLQFMLTERYKEAYAIATVRGIINALNCWVDLYSN